MVRRILVKDGYPSPYMYDIDDEPMVVFARLIEEIAALSNRKELSSNIGKYIVMYYEKKYKRTLQCKEDV